MVTKPLFFKLHFPTVDPAFPITPEAVIEAYILPDNSCVRTYAHLTPSFTEPELDGYIDDLVKELERIRLEGKRKFAAAEHKRRQKQRQKA
jgi:hypothetical protein